MKKTILIYTMQGMMSIWATAFAQQPGKKDSLPPGYINYPVIKDSFPIDRNNILKRDSSGKVQYRKTKKEAMSVVQETKKDRQ